MLGDSLPNQYGLGFSVHTGYSCIASKPQAGLMPAPNSISALTDLRNSSGSLTMLAAICAARSDSQLCEALSNTPDQSQNDQQDNRADEGVDDCGNNAAAD
jgi:hypothetical protein